MQRHYGVTWLFVPSFFQLGKGTAMAIDLATTSNCMLHRKPNPTCAVSNEVSITPEAAVSFSNSSFHRTWTGRIVLAALALFVACGNTGCSALQGLRNYINYNTATDDFVTGWRDNVWAKRAYNMRRANLPVSSYEKDFREGFIAGYRDTTNGGNGCPPALPPRVYWSWKYQTPEGQAKVDAWFRGFPHGSRAAEEDGLPFYNQIQVSGQTEKTLKEHGWWPDENQMKCGCNPSGYVEEIIPETEEAIDMDMPAEVEKPISFMPLPQFPGKATNRSDQVWTRLPPVPVQASSENEFNVRPVSFLEPVTR